MTSTTASTSIDLLADSAADLQQHLTFGRLTSLELVKQCLHQVGRLDRKGPRLRAMIALVPEEQLLMRAQHLDRERSEGRVLGPLHGIPVILKVRIAVSDVHALNCDAKGYFQYESRHGNANNRWRLCTSTD